MSKNNPTNIGNKKTTSTQLPTPDSYASHAKGNKGLSRILKAAGYSIDGFKAAYKFEAAFRQVLWLNIILFTAVIFTPFNIGIKMMLIIASFLSLSYLIQVSKPVSTTPLQNSIR